MVKVVIIVKVNYQKEKQALINCLLDVPVIDNCEVRRENAEGFEASVLIDGGIEWDLNVIVLKRAYPKEIDRAASRLPRGRNRQYNLVIAPYVSEAAAKICENYQMGFLDESGNARIIFYSLCILKTGNPNKKPESRDDMKLFNPQAVTSSLILRKLLDTPRKSWKLKYLAEEVGCSIGLVSRVKDTLCDQLWAEMTKDGLRLTEPEFLLNSWSQKYTMPEQTRCYTLDPLPTFEQKLQELKDNHGIRSYLTGFSGGVRYAPAVRYNRIHVFIHPEDIDEFITFSGCKRVDSGANVILMTAREDYIANAREQQGDIVVSPVQAYLDCMQLKGRGEELAEAIFAKELKNDTR